MPSFHLTFSIFFCTFLEPFPEKSHKGSKVRTQSLKKTPKWDQRVSKWTPGVTKSSPTGPESAKNQQHVIQGARNGATGATLELKVPTNAKQTQKTHPNSKKTHTRRCTKEPNKEEKSHDHKQPTRQPKKERGTQRNKQSNKHTHTHKSFELQTQTQTPAAGCSPKATYIRRGAFSTSCRRVGWPLAKNLAIFLELTKSVL